MESPFGSYIGTNYAPSAGELRQIFHFLKDPLDRLSSLDREIAHVAATLSHLQSERHVLQQFVDAHQALTHPIRRIPLEILLDIFAACLPTHRNPVMSTADAPLLLGRVCSSWRQISTTTPTLWSRLHIVEPGLPCQSLEAASVDHGTANDAESARSDFEARMRLRVDAVKLWLHRSGEAPLSLSLLCNTDLRSDGESAILEVLLAVRHRWERIELAGHLSMRQLQEDWGSDDVGQLQSLRLIIDRAPVSNRISQWGKLNLLRAPQLRELHIVGDTVWLLPLRLPLKWDELIELNLEVSVTANISSAVLQDILKLCPRLKTLRSWAWDGKPRLESGGILTHHALETLDLHYTRGQRLLVSLERLCGRTRFPNLRNFRFSGYTDEQVHFDFAPFILACTRLESVHVGIDLFSKTTLEEFLISLPPTLCSLCITESRIYDRNLNVFDKDALSLLVPTQTSPIPCCPGLQSFTVGPCVRFSGASLLSFIRSRMTSTTSVPLKHVSIAFPGVIKKDILLALQNFVAAGLNVDIQHKAELSADNMFTPWTGITVK